MVGLKQNSNGSWSARKRLPNDVREEYAALYGPRLEAKFYAAVGTKPALAKQEFNEWLAETEGRISAIRGNRNGDGIALTPRQARWLAGEWYHWFIVRHPISDLQKWDELRDQVQEALRDAVGDAEWERSDPDELWREDAELRREVYPVLADVGETAQFLNGEGRESFLYWLYDDLAAVLRKLGRIAQGDYGDDGYAKQFPKFEDVDKGETPQQLFDKWVSEKKPRS
jgi:hypothetical protein